MRYAVLAAVLFVAGVSLVFVDRAEQHFTPIVRMRTDNGLYMTFLQDSMDKRVACLNSVETLVHELYASCPTCSIESTDCPARMEGMESILARKGPVPLYVVAADDIRIGILGPPASVRARCELMASVMTQGGLKSAVCIPPAAPS
jgi:hypothetical protein